MLVGIIGSSMPCAFCSLDGGEESYGVGFWRGDSVGYHKQPRMTLLPLLWSSAMHF